jgi:hypothetical protein
MKRTLASFASVVLGFFSTMSLSAPLHTDYAVLFSGGGYAAINYDRYYDETLRMWNITTGVLGFAPQNVYVLFADGTNGAADRPNNVSSDWSTVVTAGGNVLDGTRNSLFDTLTYLSDILTNDDSLYFWSFDHGDTENNPNDPNDVTLVGWNDTSIQDDAFASWVDLITAKAEIFAFGQCYSGGMVDDLGLVTHPNRSAAWAAAGCEPSLGQGWVSAWADGIDSGLRWSSDLGNYALVNDIYGPDGAICQNDPSLCEHPGYAGRNINIVTNDIPEPTVLALFGVGLAGLGFSGRKRAN